MPTMVPVTLESMNYASVVFVGFVAISAFWYLIWGYRNYAGPPSTETGLDFDFATDSHTMEKTN